MSLTGFLFGNVDEEGNLSDNELDNELRNTLGEGENYLSGILGSTLFSENTDRKGKEKEDTESDTEQNIDAGIASAASTNEYASPAIQPTKDAIDFSDFNELADETAVSRAWSANLPMASASALRFNTAAVGRVPMDEDYDEEEDETGFGQDDSNVLLTEQIRTESTAQDGQISGRGLAQYGEEGAEEEEVFDDLFESSELAQPRSHANKAAADIARELAKQQPVGTATSFDLQQ
ncbi:hypothetical protein IWW36_005679, partial [Coemansia brasiliensis]